MEQVVAPRFEDLRVRPRADDTLDADFFNRRFQLVSECLSNLASNVNSLGKVEDDLIRRGLTLLNDTLVPLIDKVKAAADLGFLTATSDSVATATVGQALQIVVDDGAGVRAIFTPTPYLALTRRAADTLTQFASCRLVSYDPETGVLIMQPVYVSPDLTGAHNDWHVACSGGLFKAMEDLVAAAQTVREDLTAAQVTLDAALLSIASGAVVSVNGKTGVVTLGMGDIANLVTTLSGKAASQHGHNISEISTLQTALNAKANASEMTTALAAKADTAVMSALLAGKADAAATTTALAGKTSPADVSAAIAAATINSTQVAANFNDRTTAAETLAGSDYGKVVTFANASATTVTLPNNLPKGWNALWYQGGAGQVTFSPASGATLRQRQSRFKSAGQYASGSLIVVSNSNGTSAVYALSGDVSA